MGDSAADDGEADLNRMIYQIRYPGAAASSRKTQDGCISYFLRDPQSPVSRDRPHHFHFTYQKFEELVAYFYQKNPVPQSWMARIGDFAIAFHSEPCWQRVLLVLRQLGTESLSDPGVIFAPCDTGDSEGVMVRFGTVSEEMRQWLG